MISPESATNQPSAPGAEVSQETNPAAGVEPQDQGLQDGQSDLELGPDGQPVAPEEEFEEVEHDGKKAKIPKFLKPLLMFQGDYTRKTQEHATKVQREEAALVERAQQLDTRAQAQMSLVGEYARLAVLDQQLAPFQNVNWSAAMAQDATAAQAAWMQYQQLKEQRTGAGQRLQQLENQKVAEIQHFARQRLEEANRRLTSEIQGWSPELASKLTATAKETFGFTDAELSMVNDPRLVKLFHAAHELQVLKKNAAAASTQRAPGTASPAQAAQPIPAPTLPAGGSGNVRPITDPNLSVDDWMKRRNQQLAKAGRR
jgi:hypothetical protein